MDQERTYKWIRDRLREMKAGRITDADFRQLEVIAKDDPFVADALEGYQANPDLDHSHYLESLESRIKSHKRERRRWLIPNLAVTAVAACLILIVGFYAVMSKLSKSEDQNLATAEQQRELTIKNSGDSVGLFSPAESSTETVEPSPPVAAADEAKPSSPTTIQPGASRSKQQSDKKNESNQSNVPETQAEDAMSKTTLEAEPSGNIAEHSEAKSQPVPPAAKLDAKDLGYSANQMDPRVMAQRVAGRVTSESGDPLIGVHLVVQGTNLTTTSQLDGKFELYLPNGDAPVDVVYGGYEDQEINLKPGDENVEIKLQYMNSPMNESVLAGAATKTKRAEVASPKMSTVTLQADDNILFVDYLKTNSKYPLAENLNVSAKTVVLEFIVNIDGHPSQVKVVESSQVKALDDEAVRLIKKGPDWVCKMGYPCKVKYSIYFQQ